MTVRFSRQPRIVSEDEGGCNLQTQERDASWKRIGRVGQDASFGDRDVAPDIHLRLAQSGFLANIANSAMTPQEDLRMVRIARFAFDDHHDVHRPPLDELAADEDDCCFEVPQSASAREQNKSPRAADAPASPNDIGPSPPPVGRNSLPSEAA